MGTPQTSAWAVAAILVCVGLLWPPRRLGPQGRRGSAAPASTRNAPGNRDGRAGAARRGGIPAAAGRGDAPAAGSGTVTPKASGAVSAAASGAVSGTATAAALELLALALSAGGGLVDAVEAVGRTSTGRVRDDLGVVSAAVRWGMPWPIAWDAVGPQWAPARRAMALADAAGVAPAGALRRAAADVRADQVQALELAAARVGVAIVLPLGLAFLPAFVLLTVIPLVVSLAGEVWG